MKSYARLIVLYAIILLLASCKIPDEDDIIKEVTAEIIDTYAEPEVLPDTKTIIIEEIKEMKILPIAQYGAYIVTDDKRIKGITGKEKERVNIEFKDEEGLSYQVDDFFIKAGEIYFSITRMERGDAIPDTDPVQYETIEKTYFFKQSSGIVTEVTAMPSKPESVFVTMKDGDFQIVKYEYEVADWSKVFRGKLETAYHKIDGFYMASDGLWFSVAESDPKGIRKKGIYFYSKTANLMQSPLESGRIWK